MNNKFTTYLLYAIGEIILVVVGILIAVSIDDWNEAKQNLKREIIYLEALSKEFRVNQERLQSAMRVNQGNLKAARRLSELMGVNPSSVPIDTLRKLCLGVINAEVQYRPSNGVINEIINSGKLELFKDDSIRFMISGWEGELSKVRFQEKDELEVARQKVAEIIMESINSKNMAMNYSSNVFGLTRSKLSSKESEILSSLAFENQLVFYIACSHWLVGRYQNLYNYQEILIEKIQRNLNQAQQ
jgi:hypothetical protein